MKKITKRIKGVNWFRFLLCELFELWTKEELEFVLKQEHEIFKDQLTPPEGYYTITHTEELGKEKERYLDFVFCKIFTR